MEKKRTGIKDRGKSLLGGNNPAFSFSLEAFPMSLVRVFVGKLYFAWCLTHFDSSTRAATFILLFGEGYTLSAKNLFCFGFAS